MTDIDDRLKAMGERWRESQPDPSDAISIGFQPRLKHSTNTYWLILGVVALIGAIAMWRVLWSPDAIGPGLGLTQGQRVSAEGAIVRDKGGDFYICDPLSEDLGGRPQEFGCSAISVAVRGISASDLPGWREVGDTGRSSRVLVEGSWDTDAISVSRITPADVPTQEVPSIPCPRPAGGWPAVDESSLEFEEALRSIERLTGASPTRYARFWVARVPEDASAVAVVYTVAEAAEVESEVGAVYKLPFCVARVSFSEEDLAAASRDLAAAHPSWSLTTDFPNNRVVARLIALTEQAQESLSSRPQASADPLVRLIR